MSSAQSQQAAQSPESSAKVLPDEMDLEEVMRVMDVASTLRREQELVEREFNLDKTKQMLREKLIRTAELTGESLTPEQVEAAVNWYYDNLHEYEEPEKSLHWYLAHLYVARGWILKIAIPIALAIGAIWGLWFAPFAPFSDANQQSRLLKSAETKIEKSLKSSQAIASSNSAKTALIQLENEFKAGLENEDIEGLGNVYEKLASLESRLNEEYTLTVVSGENQQSATRRDFEDDDGTRVSGYYLVVQALDSNGKPLKREILNREKNERKTVETWAELVPKEVYDRLATDKKEDGVLNETVFGRKIRGELDLKIEIKGADNQPIERTGQITNW